MSVTTDVKSVIRPSTIVMTCVKTFRILGGFPYVWRAGAVHRSSKRKVWEKEANSTQSSLPNSLAKSTWLVVWSWAVVLGLAALAMTTPIASIFRPSKFWELLKGNTSFVATFMYLWVKTACASLLHISLFLSSTSLARVLERLSLVSGRNPRLPRNLANYGAFCLLALDLAHIFINLIESIRYSGPIPQHVLHVFPFVADCIHKIITTVLTLFVYFSTLLLTFNYKNVLPLSRPCRNETVIKFRESVQLGLQANSATDGNNAHDDFAGDHTFHRLDQKAKSQPQNTRLSDTHATAALEKLFDLQQFQGVFNEYIAMPIILLHIWAVANIIFTVYIALKITLPVITVFYMVFDLLKNIMIIILLNCAPELITHQV